MIPIAKSVTAADSHAKDFGGLHHRYCRINS
jgi:hypothetical protein